MEPRDIVTMLRQAFPAEIVGEVVHHGQTAVVARRERIKAICFWLRDEPRIAMDQLLDLCGVDYTGMGEEYFEVVYNLYSVRKRHMLRLRVQVPAGDLRIDSVTDVWAGANWPERECFDLLGIVFDGHPDLRRILLPEDWQGHPLRKDHPLQLPPEAEWPPMTELRAKAQDLRRFDFKAPLAGEERHGQD